MHATLTIHLEIRQTSDFACFQSSINAVATEVADCYCGHAEVSLNILLQSVQSLKVRYYGLATWGCVALIFY